MTTDPISDMLTRIRNANKRTHKKVIFAHSKLKEAVLKVFLDEGFIADYKVAGSGIKKEFTLKLKYGRRGVPVIRKIKRISRPGSRIRMGYREMRPVMESQGVLVVSTPRGVVSDNDCRVLKIGGEVICEIY
ncbi:MAG: 30S ribosomal protein S8 [SAR324 cluster bacterium]|nr:30S ribosomal protein S8 [SAR324 cluster bacterium]